MISTFSDYAQKLGWLRRCPVQQYADTVDSGCKYADSDHRYPSSPTAVPLSAFRLTPFST